MKFCFSPAKDLYGDTNHRMALSYKFRSGAWLRPRTYSDKWRYNANENTLIVLGNLLVR